MLFCHLHEQIHSDLQSLNASHTLPAEHLTSTPDCTLTHDPASAQLSQQAASDAAPAPPWSTGPARGFADIRSLRKVKHCKDSHIKSCCAAGGARGHGPARHAWEWAGQPLRWGLPGGVPRLQLVLPAGVPGLAIVQGGVQYLQIPVNTRALALAYSKSSKGGTLSSV